MRKVCGVVLVISDGKEGKLGSGVGHKARGKHTHQVSKDFVVQAKVI